VRTQTTGTAFAAPADYDALHRQYRGYIRALLCTNGIPDQDADDITSDILTRFMERDFLNAYDPTLTFVKEGKARRATFKTFLAKFALTYVQSKRERIKRTLYREPLVPDVGLTEGANEHDFYTFSTMRGASTDPDPIDLVYAEQLNDRIRAYLATVPRRHPADRCDLVVVFNAFTEQLRRRGAVDLNELKDHFNISMAAMHGWRWWLVANVAACLGCPCPSKRPRVLRPAVPEKETA
jgi:DNA-directed RNA polymerase specialized sigma24 family protein